MIYNVKYRVANGFPPNYCLTAEFKAVLFKTPLNKEFVDARFSVKVVAKERKKDFEISRISSFRYRTRYFTDSGIIGSKEFVAEHYQRFKHLFHSKHEKKPKPIKGLDGMYSLKRLSELI